MNYRHPPQLLELLELKGGIVTLDARGCRTEIAEKIIEEGADYVLAVKGNQGHLYEAVVGFFETAQRAHFRDVPSDYHQKTESGHGRIEVRRYWTTPVLTPLPQVSQWSDLQILGSAQTGKDPEKKH